MHGNVLKSTKIARFNGSDVLHRVPRQPYLFAPKNFSSPGPILQNISCDSSSFQEKSIHSFRKQSTKNSLITMWAVLSFSSTIFPSFRILIHLTSDKLGKDMLKAQDSLSNGPTHLGVALSPSNSAPQREVWSSGLRRDARPSLIVNPLIPLQPPIECIRCWQKNKKILTDILHVTIRDNFL